MKGFFDVKGSLALVWIAVAIAVIVVGAAVFLYTQAQHLGPSTGPHGTTPGLNASGSTGPGINNVSEANNLFALDMYRELSRTEKDKNVFFSPYSISAALAMTYEGARGQTAEEIKNVFHFPEKNVLRPNFAAIYNLVNAGSKAYELRTGNALWVQKNFPLLEEYKRVLKEYYNAESRNLDFAGDPEGSRQTINKYIENQTNNKIKNLIPPGAIGPLTRLVITNAVYFKGTWEYSFNPNNTMEMDFRVSPEEKVKVPMMYMTPESVLNYTDLGDLQVLELPYEGENLSMIILLPRGNLSDLESSLTADKLKEWEEQMKPAELVEIYLPKFEFRTGYTLNSPLKSMGMPTAFTPAANFSGMTNAGKLYIDLVVHKAYVKVDEKGTEAAAATGVVVAVTAIDVNRVIFKADHPFVFLIKHKPTGTILFMGRVVNPAAGEAG